AKAHTKIRTSVGQVKLSWSLIRLLFVEVLKRNKAVYRVLMNYTLSGIEITGNGIELGSGPASGSYRRFFREILPVNITYVDYFSNGQNVLRLDLESPLKLESNLYDFILCFNTLEHIYNYGNVVSESYRILKPGGLFIGSTPFAYRYHADPYDYFRFSHDAIERMFEAVGYNNGWVTGLSIGPFTLSLVQFEGLIPRIIRLLLSLISMLLDLMFKWVSKTGTSDYIMGYVYVFRKA
ncbi:methyltransferase domain-containing protein, partial [Chloroflexota bacterium]